MQREISLLSPVDSPYSCTGPRTNTTGAGDALQSQGVHDYVDERQQGPTRGSLETQDPTVGGLPSTSTDAAYLGETRVLSILAQEPRPQTTVPPNSSLTEVNRNHLPSLELQESFIETYFEYCWPWCPIFDQATLRGSIDTSPSPLLVNAIALLGCRIRPPIVEHADAADYYHRAKMLFYNDQETNPLLCLQSIALFYWWAPRR